MQCKKFNLEEQSNNNAAYLRQGALEVTGLPLAQQVPLPKTLADHQVPSDLNTRWRLLVIIAVIFMTIKHSHFHRAPVSPQTQRMAEREVRKNHRRDRWGLRWGHCWTELCLFDCVFFFLHSFLLLQHAFVLSINAYHRV